MRALFWNLRGFGHDGRRRQLIEYIRDEHIDIVAIQETLRSEFTLQELEHLSPHLFAWHWLPSSGTSGHSGGILLGVKDTTFEVGGMDRGEFFVSMEIFERALNFKWEVIVVYGPADHRRSPAFLDELQLKISNSPLPVLVGVTSISSDPRMRRIIPGLISPGCNYSTIGSRSWGSVSLTGQVPDSLGPTGKLYRHNPCWIVS